MAVVMHVITGLEVGGAEGMLTRLVLAQGTSWRQIVVSLTDEGVQGDALRAGGIELHRLGMRRGRPSLRGLLLLASLMRRAKPDVVMTWLYHADLAGILASILSGLSPRRVVWNLRSSNMDFALYPRHLQWVVALLARLSPLVGAVAFNSRIGRAYHASLGYRPRQWVYLPNGFDLKEWRPDDGDRALVREELGLDERAFVIGTVARVDPKKDHATFFAAAERLAAVLGDVHFVLMGGGTEHLSVPRDLASRLFVLGERQDVPRLLRAMDVAVQSSAFGEGFPNVLAEAMATGLPCVATDVGDAAEIVGDTGIIVPVRSAEMLAHAIAEILREPEEQRGQRQRRARQRIVDHFSIDRIGGLYRECWYAVGRSSATG